MKFSLQTKFYFYILPLLAILPIVIYSLITPYTQLKAGFSEFKSDAQRAQEAETLAEDINTEQLELFHLLGAAPPKSYDLAANPNYADFKTASKATDDQLTLMQTGITQDVALNDEERLAINNITKYHADFQSLTLQVLVLSAAGKKDEAFSLLGDRIDGLVSEYLRPEIEKLEVIKEDDVKTSLPALTTILTSHGVIPIPGLQSRINKIITHFENSVDTQTIGKLIDDLQAETFYQVAKEGGADYSAGDAADIDAQRQEIQDQVASTIASLRQGLSPTDPQDQDELALVARVEQAYQKLVVLDSHAVALGKNQQSIEGLALLEGSIDTFAEGTLDPLTKQLILGDKQDVQNLTDALSTQLTLITYLLYALGAAIFLIGLGGLWKLSRDIIAPIIVLRNATVRLTAGDFSTSVPVTTNDEIGDLAKAFNAMAAKLHEFYATLEDKVKTQTSELSKQVSELESTKKATINLLEDLNHEKANIQAAQAKDEAMLASIGDGFIATDSEGKIVLVNTVFEDMLGLKEAEVIGKLLVDVVPAADETGTALPTEKRPIRQALTNKSIKTKAITTTAFYTRKDGTLFPVTITVSPIITGGNLIGAVEVFRDITHEHEVDKAKSEFVSLASHQLRTPLSAIGWYAELLLEGEAGKVTKQQKEFLEQISASNNRMVALVKALLNASRIDLGTLASDPSPIDVIELAESVVGELTPQTEEREITLTKKYQSKKIVFNADANLLRIVVQNLLSNAIKYTPPKGKVTLTIALDEKNFHLTVSDTGYGIPKSQQDKIYQKLFRADNAKEKDPDGNGLGLYIVKSVIETNGGQIRFESEENKGTTFFIELPASGMKKIEGSRTLG